MKGREEAKEEIRESEMGERKEIKRGVEII